jgi:hypothetical protein
MSVPWLEVARANCTAESIEMCELLNTENHYCFDANNKGPLYFPLDGKLGRGGKALLPRCARRLRTLSERSSTRFYKLGTDRPDAPTVKREAEEDWAR